MKRVFCLQHPLLALFLLVMPTVSSSPANTAWHLTAVAAAADDFPAKPEAKIKKDPASKTHSVVMKQKFNAPMTELYEILIDYKSFPEFMPHTRESKVIREKEQGQKKWVQYKLVFLLWFDVNYILEIDHDLQRDSARIQWKLDSGDYFNAINGSWELTKLSSDASATPPPTSGKDSTTTSPASTANNSTDSSTAASSSPATDNTNTQNSNEEATGVTYVSQIDTKVSIPGAIFNLITEQSVYDLFAAVEKRLAEASEKTQKKEKASEKPSPSP